MRSILDAFRRRGTALTLLAVNAGGAPGPGMPEPVPLTMPKGLDPLGRERARIAINDASARILGALPDPGLVYERLSLFHYRGMEFARERGLPSVLEVNAPLIEEQRRHRRLLLEEPAEAAMRRALAAAGVVVAVSEGVAASLEPYPECRGKVRVIPNGVDLTRFAPGPPRRADGPVVVGFLGTLKPWHGLDDLADGFVRARKEGADVRLEWIGHGPQRDRIARRLEADGVADRVVWHGAVAPERVPALLRGLDIAVAPYPEGGDDYFSPLKLYEYMATGLAIVATRVGQAARVLRDGEHALLVPPGDVGALARAIGALAARPTLRARLGASARRLAERAHGWDDVLSRILESVRGGAVMGRPMSLRDAWPTLARFATRLREPLRAELPTIAAALAAVLAQAAIRVAEPWPIKWLIDDVTGARPLGGGWSGRPEGLVLLGLAFVLLVGARAGAGYASAVGFAAVGNRLLVRVRRMFFDHLQRLSPSTLSRARRGDLVLRAVADVSVVKEVLVTAGMPLLAGGLVFLGMVGVMAWIEPRLTAAALIPVPLYLGFAMRTGRRVREVGRKQRRREGALAASAEEALAVAPMAQSLGLQERLAEAFGALGEAEGRVGVQGKRLSARLERSVDVLIGICTAVVLVYGGSLAFEGTLSAGDLVVFATYVRRGLRPLRDFAKYGARIAKASAASERVLEVLDQAPAVVERPDARAREIVGALRFEDVDVELEPGRRALAGLSLEVPAGSSVALTGPSGAGKSTLLGLVPRLHDPTQGRVLLDGEDLRAWTLASLREQISVLLQEPMLLSGSVFENVACGEPGADEARVREALERAQAWTFVERLPSGWHTDILEDGASLSRGERQRIAIARAIHRRARIVLLDEPTTGLDAAAAAAVREGLRALTAGRTVLWATHDPADAAACDRVVRLVAGRLAPGGAPGSKRADERNRVGLG